QVKHNNLARNPSLSYYIEDDLFSGSPYLLKLLVPRLPILPYERLSKVIGQVDAAPGTVFSARITERYLFVVEYLNVTVALHADRIQVAGYGLGKIHTPFLVSLLYRAFRYGAFIHHKHAFGVVDAGRDVVLRLDLFPNAFFVDGTKRLRREIFTHPGKHSFQLCALIRLERRSGLTLHAAAAKAGAQIARKLGVEQIIGDKYIVYSKHNALNVE